VSTLRDESPVPVDDLVPGDRLLVPTGTVVPVDGVVEGGTAVFDESALTGEALPAEYAEGAGVRSGTVNAAVRPPRLRGGDLDLRVPQGAARPEGAKVPTLKPLGTLPIPVADGGDPFGGFCCRRGPKVLRSRAARHSLRGRHGAIVSREMEVGNAPPRTQVCDRGLRRLPELGVALRRAAEALVIGARVNSRHGAPLGGETVPAVLSAAPCEVIVCENDGGGEEL
jgi:hypothetical protein